LIEGPYKFLYHQALVVSHELIRVAILWHEQWHEKLEEASRQYYTEHNPEGMIAALEPLHEELERVGGRLASFTDRLAAHRIDIRGPKLRARPPSSKHSVVSFKRRERRRADTRNMARLKT
jgi:phosphatidylinositol kinase/protein kinase (PI-3  family)